MGKAREKVADLAPQVGIVGFGSQFWRHWIGPIICTSRFSEATVPSRLMNRRFQLFKFFYMIEPKLAWVKPQFKTHGQWVGSARSHVYVAKHEFVFMNKEPENEKYRVTKEVGRTERSPNILPGSGG
ncbi:4-diphosphocytidyl-2-C-methyl-D-erythritolkinase [Striga asiatica]|uniref:4-diphosphocytidyl-2-C-methyl-D-erythritolkinase n=1 Tax=Striga asiatica TaxID=4170 RepID=A0A5A7NWR5_STRAF|nr:4-diphosphocytidyl-2-C-methyl-D-erythritolkinase [Striga asiatica]